MEDKSDKNRSELDYNSRTLKVSKKEQNGMRRNPSNNCCCCSILTELGARLTKMDQDEGRQIKEEEENK